MAGRLTLDQLIGVRVPVPQVKPREVAEHLRGDSIIHLRVGRRGWLIHSDDRIGKTGPI